MGFVKPITGVGITSRVDCESADLGIARWDMWREANAVMFGDNYSRRFMQGEWQSPSILMYDDDYNLLGIPTDTGVDPNGHRQQLWPYQHDNAEYSTVLPCDFIRIGDFWHVAVMVTKGLGHELRTEFHRSHDLVTWEPQPEFTINHPSHPGMVMLTFDQVYEWVYIFGTGGLARNKPIWLWRCPADTFPRGVWEPFGSKPILDGTYGELCYRHIQGNSVLSFFDSANYRQTALTVPRPGDNWKTANRLGYAFGKDFPQLYGGYITPASRLNEAGGMGFLVSQWDTSDNDPYRVCLFKGILTTKKGISEPAPPPQPVQPTGLRWRCPLRRRRREKLP